MPGLRVRWGGGAVARAVEGERTAAGWGVCSLDCATLLLGKRTSRPGRTKLDVLSMLVVGLRV